MKCARIPILFLMSIALLTTACKNMFSELADKNSDDAIFFAAQQQSDQKNYGNAITLVGTLSAPYQAQRNVQVFLASAYAGRCGLDYLTLADAAINNPTNATIMQLALNQMKNANATTTTLADCQKAESILRTASPAGDGIMSDNVDDAFLMAFVSLAKLGSELAINAPTGGNVGCGFLGLVNPAGNKVDQDVATALTLIYTNLQSVSSAFTSKMSGLTSLCSSSIATATCSKTTGSSFSLAELKSMMGVVNYQSFGVGTQASYTACP